MRFTDLFLVVPSIAILALAIEYFGHSTFWIIMVLALLFWMSVARVVRGQVLSLREKEFVEAAKASGASPTADHRAPHRPQHDRPDHVERHARRRGRDHHRVDAVVPRVRAAAAADVVGAHARRTPRGTSGPAKSYLLYAPGLAIMLTVLVVNFIGDGLSDAFDPQSGRD